MYEVEKEEYMRLLSGTTPRMSNINAIAPGLLSSFVNMEFEKLEIGWRRKHPRQQIAV